MTSIAKTPKNGRRTFLFIVILFISVQDFAQGTSDWRLEKMPVDLETDYALSALPPHLRNDATVYLLDPQKGFYVAAEKAIIVEDGKDLLKRLAAYKAYLKTEPAGSGHHHGPAANSL